MKVGACYDGLEKNGAAEQEKPRGLRETAWLAFGSV